MTSPATPPQRPATRTLPLVPLRDMVVFPRMMAPFVVGRASSIAALEAALLHPDKGIFLAAQRDPKIDEPAAGDIHETGVVATLHDLDRTALVSILKEPKNSLIKQYQTLLEFENVSLRFTDDALESISDEAIVRNVGARGLKIILEELMLDIMYRVPSEEEIEECVITKEVVQRRAAPILSLRKVG